MLGTIITHALLLFLTNDLINQYRCQSIIHSINQLKHNKHIIKELYFLYHNYIFFNIKERG